MTAAQLERIRNEICNETRSLADRGIIDRKQSAVVATRMMAAVDRGRTKK